MTQYPSNSTIFCDASSPYYEYVYILYAEKYIYKCSTCYFYNKYMEFGGFDVSQQHFRDIAEYRGKCLDVRGMMCNPTWNKYLYSIRIAPNWTNWSYRLHANIYMNMNENNAGVIFYYFIDFKRKFSLYIIS